MREITVWRLYGYAARGETQESLFSQELLERINVDMESTTQPK